MTDHPHLPQAVALKYEVGTRDAPKVVAKGQGAIAERMVALARENDVVVQSNPYLTQALAHVPLDDAIPVELFEAAAEVIGFVLRAQRRMVKAAELEPFIAPVDAIDIPRD